MKWHQHRSDHSDDLAAQVLIEKHGMEGWGFYLFIKERICRRFDSKNISLTTEEDARRLARHGNIDYNKALEILETCTKSPAPKILPLLDLDPDTGFIRCRSILWEMDNTTIRNAEIQKMVAFAQKKHDYVGATEELRSNDVADKITEIRKKDDGQTEMPCCGPKTVGVEQGIIHANEVLKAHSKGEHKGQYIVGCDACAEEKKAAGL